MFYVQLAVQSADCSADSDQTCTFQYTNGRSIKNMIGMVVNRLVGMGLKEYLVIG